MTTYPTLAKVPADRNEVTDKDGNVWKRYDGHRWHMPSAEGVHESNVGHVVSDAQADLYGPFYVRG